MAKENLIDTLIIVGGIAGVIIYKDQILQFLKDKLGKPNPTGECPQGQHKNSAGQCVPDSTCNKTCTAGTHLDSNCNCVPDDITTGGTWYKANGPTAAMPRGRCSTGKCGAGSGNSGGNRWENEVTGFMEKGFEVVVYFQIPPGKMCSGGHIGLKHGGPNHTSPCGYSTSGKCGGSGCCCWWDSGIDNDAGKAYLEIEASHPNNCGRKYFAAANTKLDSGKPIGVRWHISREGSGIRLIMWLDTSGTVGGNKWREMYNVLDTGQFMPTSYYSKIPSLLNIEIRISHVACGDIKMLQGPTSRKIVSGTSGLEPSDIMIWSPYENFRLA